MFAVFGLINAVQFKRESFRKTLSDYANKTHNRKLQKNMQSIVEFLAVMNIVNIAFCIISMITAIFLFPVVEQYIAHNKKRRAFLLPYIIFNTLMIIAGIILLIVLNNKFKSAKAVDMIIVVFSIFGIAIRVLFVTLMALCYRSLVRYSVTVDNDLFEV